MKITPRFAKSARTGWLVCALLPFPLAFVAGGACIPNGDAPGRETPQEMPFDEARISLALPAASVVLGQVPDPLVNGGFEQGNGGGWVQWAFPKGQAFDWVYPGSGSAEGTHHQLLQSLEDGSFGLYQVLDSEPGRTYRVTGYMKAVDNGSNWFEILLFNGDLRQLAESNGQEVGEYIVLQATDADIMTKWESGGRYDGRPRNTWTRFSNSRRATGTKMTVVTKAAGSGAATVGRHDGVTVKGESSVVIRWTDVGVEAGGATVSVEVEKQVSPDDAQPPPNTGPYDILVGRNAVADGDADLFEWFGLSAGGAHVEAGTYLVRARLADSLGELHTSEARGRVTVPFVFVNPTADLVLAGGATLTIKWTDETFGFGTPVVRLVIDADEDHADDDEITIMDSRRLDLDEEDDDQFRWDGNDTEGVRPAAGPYFLSAIIDPDGGTPIRVASPGKIVLRNAEPTVVVSQPDSDKEIATNESVSVAWTADDPDDDATITVWYDADEDATFDRSNPPANIIEDDIGEDETSVNWDTTGVAEGTYSIFVTIDDGSSDPITDAAPGRITVPNAVPKLTFTQPTDDVTVVIGSTVMIAWNAEDAEDNVVDINLYVDLDTDHENGNETLIKADADNSGSWPWDPEQESELVPGRYFLVARVDDGVRADDTSGNPTRPAVYEAEGAITVQAHPDDPTIVLTKPLAAVTATVGQTVAIRWKDENTTADTKIVLRYDDDPKPNQDGADELNEDEKTIQADLAAEPDDDEDQHEWDWHPDQIAEQAVPAGDYYIFAYIDDDGDPLDGSLDAVAVANGKVTIPNTAPDLEFVKLDPDADDDYTNAFDLGSENAEVVPGTSPRITWHDRDPEDDAKITLLIDPDETDHENGNEIELFLAHDLSEDTDNGPGGEDGDSQYDWSLTRKADGSPVDDLGQYTLFARIDDGQGHAELIEATRKINLRQGTDQPVVLITSQVTEEHVSAGAGVTITWKDLHAGAGDTISVTYDDDPDVDESPEAGESPETIAQGITAALDGPSDSIVWDTTGVADGHYYIHVRIDGTAGHDTSTSASRVKVNAPNEPPVITVVEVAGASVGGDINVEQGSDPSIKWDGYDPEGDARIKLIIRSVSGGSDVVLAQNILADDDPDDVDSYLWSSTRDKDGNLIDNGFYTLIAQINDDENPVVSSEVPGRILLRERTGENWAPLMRVTSPITNISVDLGDPIEFAWEDDDPEDDATIVFKLDADEFPENGAGDVEVPLGTIHEDPDLGANDERTWDVAAIVEPGTYNLYAVIDDGVNDPQVVETNSAITLRNVAPTFVWVEPTTVQDVVKGAPPLTLAWSDNDPDHDAEITLGIDPDSNHTNGNEIVVLTPDDAANGDKLREDDDADTVDWDLQRQDGSARGAEVETGWYFVYALIDDGLLKVRVTAPGKVRVHVSDMADPVVVLLDPVEGKSGNIRADQTITVKWDDWYDTDNGYITVELDDDVTPGEGDEINILSGRREDPDEVSDQVDFQIPSGLINGHDYYIHVRIDDNNDSSFEDTSTSGPLEYLN